MYRLSSRLNSRISSKVVRQSGRRLQSTQAGGGSGGKVLLGAAAATSGLAGVVGYSAWSPENRRGVENAIPGSGYLLGPILGPPPEVLPPKLPKVDVGLVRKKLDREKKKKEETTLESAKPETALTTDVVPEPVETPSEANKEEVTEAVIVEATTPVDPVGGISPEILGAETTGKKNCVFLLRYLEQRRQAQD